MSRPAAHHICKRNSLAPRNLTALRSDQLRRWTWPVSATQSGSPVTARGGRESGHRVGPDDGARYVVGVVLEAVERYWADVALAYRASAGS
jgi:hypothetical protein